MPGTITASETRTTKAISKPSGRARGPEGLGALGGPGSVSSSGLASSDGIAANLTRVLALAR